ncbi:hypothetical protein V6Z12_A01G122200 [Gossypium hirsutum]
MEKIILNFVWGSTDEKRKISLIKWEEVCKPIKSGGLGFKILSKQNDAFLMKIGFNLIQQSNQRWIQVLRTKYKCVEKVPQTLHTNYVSRLWKGMSKVWETVRDGVIWNVGNGKVVDFWRDE